MKYIKNLKFAFTLAEVLITIAIIGVVAALTIPGILQQYTEKMTEARLAKFYSMMNQAIQMSSIENGAPETWDFAYREQDEEGNVINKSEISAAIFDKYLGKYMKINKREELMDVDFNRKMILYYLADGSAFGFPPHTNIDIHYFPYKPAACMKKQQSRGICRFMFTFAPALKASNVYGYENVSYQNGISPFLFRWDGEKETLYKGGSYNEGCDLDENGGYCTAIIAKNGWKIPDDYPRKIRY